MICIVKLMIVNNTNHHQYQSTTAYNKVTS